MHIFFIVFSIFKVHAQDIYVETSPWEPEDIKPIYTNHNIFFNYETSPFILLANKLIEYYQKEVAPESISRCPFYISCSNYAYYAINKYGLYFGLAFFIDRNLYRENSLTYLYYKFRETDSGILKLDDSYYLFNNTKTK